MGDREREIVFASIKCCRLIELASLCALFSFLATEMKVGRNVPRELEEGGLWSPVLRDVDVCRYDVLLCHF